MPYGADFAPSLTSWVAASAQATFKLERNPSYAQLFPASVAAFALALAIVGALIAQESSLRKIAQDETPGPKGNYSACPAALRAASDPTCRHT
jgi:hypothetical protein